MRVAMFNYIKKFISLKKNHYPSNSLFFIGVLFLRDYIKFGVSIQDFYSYDFANKTAAEKSAYVTCRKHKMIQDHFNNSEACNVFYDKAKFNKAFGSYLHREWLDLEECSIEELKCFLDNHQICFLKDKTGTEGRGVKRIKSKGIGDLQLFIKSMKGFILEEELLQSDFTRQFNPNCLNTIRVVTVNTGGGNVEIICATFRMGNGETHTDNFHTDGIVANIDTKTGRIDSLGIDRHDIHYETHPYSNKKIVGTVIKNWNDIAEFAKNLSIVEPKVGYVGWDIAILKDNVLAVIEGNNNAHHDIQQLPQGKGIWEKYKTLIEEKNGNIQF